MLVFNVSYLQMRNKVIYESMPVIKLLNVLIVKVVGYNDNDFYARTYIHVLVYIDVTVITNR